MPKAKYQVQSYCIDITIKFLAMVLIKGASPRTTDYIHSQVIHLESVISSLTLLNKLLLIPLKAFTSLSKIIVFH